MDYFSTGLSKGRAFCNRTKEREHLKKNIDNNIHTLVIASRRLGKTSLIQKVIQEAKYPCIKVDLLIVSSVEDAQQLIIESISEYLVQSAPTIQKIKPLLTKFFKSFKPNLSIGMDDKISLELSFQAGNSKMTLIKLLNALNSLAESQKQKLVIFLDEFQQLLSISNGETLEAAIRHVAQETTQLTFIFSGSQRHILTSMFEKQEKPLYRLCHHMSLGFISCEDFYKHIQKAAKGTWKQLCDDSAVNRILELTECHTYCVNALCTRLWMSDTPPTIRKINATWAECVEQDKRTIASDINRLSANQRAVLVYIAWNPYSQPSSKVVLSKINLSMSSMMQAHRELIHKDYVQWNENLGHFSLINPMVKALLMPYAEKLFA